MPTFTHHLQNKFSVYALETGLKIQIFLRNLGKHGEKTIAFVKLQKKMALAEHENKNNVSKISKKLIFLRFLRILSIGMVFCGVVRLAERSLIFGDADRNSVVVSSGSRTRPINCSRKSFRRIPTNTDFPLIALASFMGSGNTWVRHLLHKSSSYWTGSVYTDTALHQNSMLPEWIKPINCTNIELICITFH